MKANAVAPQHRADPARGIGELRQVAPSIGLGWARVQATSRGGHGDKAHYNRGVLYGAEALTSNRVLPHCEGRRTLETGPEAIEIKVSTTPSARAAPHRGGFSVGLKRHWLHDAASFMAKTWKSFGTPIHPTVAPGPQEEGWRARSRVERSSQCSSTATPS